MAATKEEVNRGAWTVEEDQKLAEVIATYGAKKWKMVAAKAGLNRCGKSCRLRWMNYLRPNIKRGNISDQEEDLILRLHKLLGNRWSLIAGRLPGRTDNEIKNYWNSHLSKKAKHSGRHGNGDLTRGRVKTLKGRSKGEKQSVAEVEEASKGVEDSTLDFDVDDFFDFSNESPLNWVGYFHELNGEIK